ncbi:MAG TPA: copper homeostasis protein CutC [Candidatus Eisenbacteria bacterium]|nr:copper homeostasis protein CutC [Candidatus Eisenbacteria bacterium]
MSRKCLLEISVESLEAALAAARGGADRIELCGNLSAGGITPSIALMHAVREHLSIPVFVMIRPRAGDFVYSDAEFSEMRRSIVGAKESGMDGVILGILTKDHRVDVERTRELVEFAKPLPVTYHRAFDEAADLRQALEGVIQSGAKRILTSGGAKSALEGAAMLADLVEAAGERIVIVPGAGISAANIEQVAQRTGAREFHSGLSAVLPYGSKDYRKSEDEVRKLAKQIARISGTQTDP